MIARLSVRNETGLPLQAVRFPVLALPARLGEEGADDRVLLPHGDGLEIENPAENLRDARAAQYPGGASMQLLSVYDSAGGFFLAALDGEGHRKQLGVAPVGDTVEPLLTHYPAVEARTQWALSYPVVLGAFSGDWQIAAEMYRAWAQGQSWCRAPLWKRKDLPAWLLQRRSSMPSAARRRSPRLSQESVWHRWRRR